MLLSCGRSLTTCASTECRLCQQPFVLFHRESGVPSFYSQVFWTGLPPVDLPADVVSRFAGKGMVVAAFEMDQVQKDPKGGPDISVPINVVYNHHFESNMVGARAHFEKVVFDGPDDPRLAELKANSPHGTPDLSQGHWLPVEHDASGALPSKMAFGGANGGEYRKSFHGYAPGYGQIIESPTQLQVTPMQVGLRRG